MRLAALALLGVFIGTYLFSILACSAPHAVQLSAPDRRSRDNRYLLSNPNNRYQLSAAIHTAHNWSYCKRCGRCIS